MQAIKLNSKLSDELSEKVLAVFEGLSKDQAEHILDKYVKYKLQNYSVISSEFRSQTRAILHEKTPNSSS